MGSPAAMSWFRAIADTAIGAIQGSDPINAAYTIDQQLHELMAAIGHGERPSGDSDRYE